MKNKKLTDAIGMISDDFIEEAHKPKKRFSFSLNRQTLMRLAAVGACFLLAVTILPKMFHKAASGGNSAADYYYEPSYSSSSNGYYPGGGYAAMDEEAYYAEDAKEDYSYQEGNSTPPSLKENKKLILNADMSLETMELDELIATVNAGIDAVGGYIQSSSIATRGSSRYYEATIRIPADRYEEFLGSIKQEGNLVSYSESVKDITDSYTDIEARLTSLRAQEAKVLEFYDRAETIEELMSIEQRLSDISYEIGYYETQLKNYDLLVAYSTLNLSIRETKTYTPENTSFFSRLKNAFVSGWYDFTEGIGDFIIDVIYNLWTIILLAAIAFAGYKIYKRFFKKNR